jgi:putative redox protein
MPVTIVRWVTGRQFVGTDERNHSVVLSADNPATGVSPSQMLLIGMAACSAYDVLEVMIKKRKPLTMLEIIANGEQDPQPPWAYRSIHLKYRVSGKGVTEKAMAQAVQLSIQKYCSVAATARGVAALSSEIEIVS